MKGRIIGFAMLIAAVAAGAFPAAGEAAFPGQNGRIAFSSNRDGDFDIYSIDPAVGEASLLQLTNVAGSDERPAYSPGGAKIAFSSTRSGNSDIWLMNSDGSNPTRLTSNPASDTRATFSPDGTKVAFASNRGGDEEIWVMDAAGSDPAQLTNAANTSANPDFSATSNPSNWPTNPWLAPDDELSWLPDTNSRSGTSGCEA